MSVRAGNAAHAAHHLLASFRRGEIDQQLGGVGIAGFGAEAQSADGNDDGIEGFDPVHRRAVAFHALEAKVIGPGERHLAGAEQLRGEAVTAPP